jgi:RNA polymerase sigma-70 factor (ECF subfamily)
MTKQAQTEPQSELRPPALESIFPFLPGVYSHQSVLPALAAAERQLLEAIVFSRGTLAPDQRIQLMQAVIRAQAGTGTDLLGHSPLESVPDPGLEELALKLSSWPPSLSRQDIECLTKSGLGTSALVEAVCAVAIGKFLLTLAKASGVKFEPRSVGSLPESNLPKYSRDDLPELAFLETPSIEPDDLKRSYTILREQYGFVPNLYRIQSHSPDLVNAQVNLLDAVLFPEDHLSRVQKELIVLRLAALNFNTPLATMQVNILGLLGTGSAECDQVIDTLHSAPVSPQERVLLEETGTLSLSSTSSQEPFDPDRLQNHGFTEPQMIEAETIGALANFLSVIQLGLNPPSDFPPHRVFSRKDLYQSHAESRPISDGAIDDPDSSLVSEVKEGNTEVFANLVRRHTRRVFGTLAGMLGNIDDARDSTQDVFLKAFQNIDKFQGRSKFSTWIMSIAVNTGTELLRQRRPTESLDETDDESRFRPRQIQSWVPDPEQQLAKTQINDLVRQGILRLPEKYKIALLLRDINQVPTEEAAAALSLSVPALKARVLRGRLMLRESLAPHFSSPRGENNV